MDTDGPSAAGAATTVAQNCILPYRGFEIRRPSTVPKRGQRRAPAECNSAIQRIPNPRYLLGIRQILCQKAAAERGDVMAQYNLGIRYSSGRFL